MKTLYKTVSTNGRWGLEVVGPDDAPQFKARVGYPGTVRALGEAGGILCYEYIPAAEPAETYVAILGKATAIEGASIGAFVDLQSSSYVTVAICRPKGIVQVVGYKGRSSEFLQLQQSEEGFRFEAASPALLLAAGIIKPHNAALACVQPPPFNPVFEQALKSTEE